MGSLWHYNRDEPVLDDASVNVNFPGNSASFKHKQKRKGSIENNGAEAVKLIVPLKYLSNFWRPLETPLINREINLVQICPVKFVMFNSTVNEATIFEITDTKLYVSVVTSSTQDNAKLLQ